MRIDSWKDLQPLCFCTACFGSNLDGTVTPIDNSSWLQATFSVTGVMYATFSFSISGARSLEEKHWQQKKFKK